MSINALTSASHSALNGLRDVARQVEDVATNVAAGISSEPGSSASESLGEIAKLPGLKMQAKANAAVLSTVDDLFSELSSVLRK